MSSAIAGAANSIAAVVVVFGLCLLCHELGHFLLAKLFRMQVDEFALGFGPALWRRKRGDTTYRLNLIPYAAYVKIAGMEPGSQPAPGGFHTRPRWQAGLVLLGGSAANLALAAALFAVVTMWTGVPDPSDQGIYIQKVMPGTPAALAGVRARDQIVAVDGQTESLHVNAVSPGSPAAAVGIRADDFIERVGGEEVFVPADVTEALRAAPGPSVRVAVIDYKVEDLSKQQRLIALAVPPAARRAGPEDASEALGRMLGLRFEPMTQRTVVGYIGNRVQAPVRLGLRRDGQVIQVTAVTASANDRVPVRDDSGKLYTPIRPVGRIGVVLRGAAKFVTPPQAAMVGLRQSVTGAMTVILGLQLMLRGQVEAELAGPVAIMALSAESARVGWDQVLNWGGLISSTLAIMNMFPIPPFDGFRLVLLGFEGLIGRRIAAQKELVISIAGFVVIIFLFVVLTFKDVANLVRYGTP